MARRPFSRKRPNLSHRYHVLQRQHVRDADPYKVVATSRDIAGALSKAAAVGRGARILDTETWSYVSREDREDQAS